MAFVDEYCQFYEDVFPDVRSFEHFKQIQIGMLSEKKRKTLPAIAKATARMMPKPCTTSWQMRLSKRKQALARKAFTLCIDRLRIAKEGK